MTASATEFWCERAWLPGGVRAGVLVRAESGTVTTVSGVEIPPAGATRLHGLVYPGFANVHSHAFHRALRGRTNSVKGTFWTWRAAMYELARRLNPESYHRLARAVFAEMVVAGVSCVGEFHYLHHGPGGVPYDDPNAMGEALRSAAHEAGIRLTLLDTCYLAGGIGTPPDATQQRFCDGDADRWAQRVAALAADATTRIGAAVHSVRAVPRDQLPTVAKALGPLHVHLSEQPAENEQCRAAYGDSPTAVLADAGVIDTRSTAVHATHLDDDDVRTLGSAGSFACFCPTTEADLADGIGPARELADAGARLCLGTDQHAQLDPFAEMRGLEHGERLRSGTRGRFPVNGLVEASTVQGHASLGWPEAGRIGVGAPCDLVAVAGATARTAGSVPEQLPLVATAADVHTVVVGGKTVARQGEHAWLGDVGRMLAEEIERVWA